MAELVPTSSLLCQQGAVRAVRYNVDGDYCITCGSDKSLKLWNPMKKMLLQTYSGHGYEVLDARGSTDNSRLASCGMDRMVFVWDVTAAQPIRRYRGHAGHVNCVSFNEDSSVLFSGSVDCSVKAWDCKSNSREPIQTFAEAKDSVSSICVSDQEVVIASLDSHVRIYDLRRGLMHSDNMFSPVNHVCHTKDKQCVLVSCMNDLLKLVDKRSGEVLSEYKGHVNRKYRIECGLINNDSLVVSGSESANVLCWDLLKGEVKHKFYHPNHRVVHSVNCHPEKNEILTAAEGNVYLWELDGVKADNKPTKA